MKTTPGYFTLTPDQRRFKELLAPYPTIADFWDFNDKSVDLDAVKNAAGTQSHGEQILTAFFVSVWLGENSGFDLIDAVKTLDNASVKLITDWVADPFFP